MPKIRKWGILVVNLKIFIFARNFALEKFEGANFKYDYDFFKFQSKNTQIKQFLS